MGSRTKAGRRGDVIGISVMAIALTGVGGFAGRLLAGDPSRGATAGPRQIAINLTRDDFRAADRTVMRGTRPGAMTSGTFACAACHKIDPMFSHPVDVIPDFPIPEGLPLSNGRITCLTCHEDPGAEHGYSGGAGPGGLGSGAGKSDKPLLRRLAHLRPPGDAELLCVQCHGRGQGKFALHGSGVGRAHLHGARPNARVTRLTGTLAPVSRSGAARAAINLDSGSRTCLGCHDGTLAQDVCATPRVGSFRANGEHPVGIRHQSTAVDAMGRPTTDMQLLPASSLDDRLQLFDGNIGCGTCHSPYSTHPKQLVMSNTRSALCFSCHRG